MDISDLHYFTAAPDAGSFSSAGKALGRDPSALSRRIGGLEDELGLPLFERKHGGVLLTSGGKAVLLADATLVIRGNLCQDQRTEASPFPEEPRTARWNPVLRRDSIYPRGSRWA